MLFAACTTHTGAERDHSPFAQGAGAGGLGAVAHQVRRLHVRVRAAGGGQRRARRRDRRRRAVLRGRGRRGRRRRGQAGPNLLRRGGQRLLVCAAAGGVACAAELRAASPGATLISPLCGAFASVQPESSSRCKSRSDLTSSVEFWTASDPLRVEQEMLATAGDCDALGVVAERQPRTRPLPGAPSRVALDLRFHEAVSPPSAPRSTLTRSNSLRSTSNSLRSNSSPRACRGAYLRGSLLRSKDGRLRGPGSHVGTFPVGCTSSVLVRRVRRREDLRKQMPACPQSSCILPYVTDRRVC